MFSTESLSATEILEIRITDEHNDMGYRKEDYLRDWLWKCVKETSLQIKLGSPEGVALLHHYLPPFTSSNWNKLILRTLLGERFSSGPATAQPMTNCYTQPMRSHHHSCSSLMDLHSKQSLPAPPFSLPKSSPLLHFLDLPMVHQSAFPELTFALPE